MYRTFVEKFNAKYENGLLQEQKELLTHYITSFVDNALELKIYLNDEIARLKEQLEKAKEVKEIKSDEAMFKKTNDLFKSSCVKNCLDPSTSGSYLGFFHFHSPSS